MFQQLLMHLNKPQSLRICENNDIFFVSLNFLILHIAYINEIKVNGISKWIVENWPGFNVWIKTADIETITKKSIQIHPKRLCKKVPFFFKKINKPRGIASIAKIAWKKIIEFITY